MKKSKKLLSVVCSGLLVLVSFVGVCSHVDALPVSKVSVRNMQLSSFDPKNLQLDDGEQLINPDAPWSPATPYGNPFPDGNELILWARTTASGEVKFLACNNRNGGANCKGNGFHLFSEHSLQPHGVKGHHAGLFAAKHKGGNKFTIDYYGYVWGQIWPCTFHNWNVKGKAKKGVNSMIQTWSWNNKDEEKFYITYNQTNNCYRIWSAVNGLPVGCGDTDKNATLKNVNDPSTYFQLYVWIDIDSGGKPVPVMGY